MPAAETDTTVDPPEGAHWFGLEAYANDRWQRCRSDQLGGMWWRPGLVDPKALAESFGAGDYRVIWAPADRRRTLGYGLPFAIRDGNAPEPEAEEPEDEEPEAEEPEAEEPEAEEPEAEEPEAEEPEAEEPRRFAAAPGPRTRRGRPTEHGDMPRMPLEALAPPPGVELHPLGQTVYLSNLAQQRSDQFHMLLLESMRLMLESERSRSREHAQNVAQHYQAMDKVRSDFLTATLRLQATPPPAPNLEIARLAEQVRQLTEQLQTEDDGAGQELAKLSDSPTELERALVALQNVVGALANSPLGSALAERLVGKPHAG